MKKSILGLMMFPFMVQAQVGIKAGQLIGIKGRADINKQKLDQ